MAKETYFFSHDCNARNDERILMLRADHGMEGYGIYWALIEMMFESSETCLYHDKIKGIAVSYNLPITKLQDTINSCISEGLFSTDSNTFWSESLRRRKEKYHSMLVKRSEGGKKAMENRWSKKANTNGCDNLVISELQDSNSEVITPDNKGEERRGNKNREEVKSSRFTPPTLQDVSNYCLERNNNVDPNRFIDWNESKGWLVGKSKMKDWKAAVRTWENRDKKQPQQSTKSEFEQMYSGLINKEEEDYGTF